jgi:hypothetical protein
MLVRVVLTAGMFVRALRVARLLPVIVMTAAVAAPGAGAVVVRLRDGAKVGVQLQAGVSPRSLGTSQQSAGPNNQLDPSMQYNGGPVLHTVRPYLVFWDPPAAAPISDRSRQVIERYLTDVAKGGAAAVDTYSVSRQYFDASGFADSAQTFNAAQQVISDVNSYPPQDSTTCTKAEVSPSYPFCLTDAQVQDELAQLINADGLPTGIGQGAPVYLVITPSDVNVCQPGVGCANNTFCGYHGEFSDGSGAVVYALVSFLPITPDPTRCQVDGLATPQEPNGDVADVIIDDLSHESVEAITDPLGTGWYDNYTGNEVADNCEATGPYDPADHANPTDPNAYLPTLGGQPSSGTLFDQLIAGDRYYTQTVWSNGEGGCVPAPAQAGLTAAFTSSPPALAGSRVSMVPSGSAASAGISSTTWSFGDGASAFAIGPPASVSHIYSRHGVYNAVLTLVDARGNLSTALRRITVYGTPSARFVGPARAAVRASVVFDGRASSDPNAGARLVSYRWSFGDGGHASGLKVHHDYRGLGVHRVTLTVTDTLGLSASGSRLLLVHGSTGGRNARR